MDAPRSASQIAAILGKADLRAKALQVLKQHGCAVVAPVTHSPSPSPPPSALRTGSDASGANPAEPPPYLVSLVPDLSPEGPEVKEPNESLTETRPGSPSPPALPEAPVPEAPVSPEAPVPLLTPLATSLLLPHPTQTLRRTTQESQTLSLHYFPRTRTRTLTRPRTRTQASGRKHQPQPSNSHVTQKTFRHLHPTHTTLHTTHLHHFHEAVLTLQNASTPCWTRSPLLLGCPATQRAPQKEKLLQRPLPLQRLCRAPLRATRTSPRLRE